MRARRTTFLAVAAFGAFAAGCNLIMDLGRFSEAATVSDGGGGGVDAGPPEAGPFDCLNNPTEPTNPNAVTLHLLIIDATQTTVAAQQIDGGSELQPVVYTPLPGITMMACGPLDPQCKNPVVPPQTTDDGGFVTFSLTGDFAGFFLGANSAGSIVPFSFYPGKWLTGVSETVYYTDALNPQEEQLLNQSLGGGADLDAGSGLGEIFVVTYDCFEHSVPGVRIALSSTGLTTLPFYINNGVPSLTAGQTDDEGVGGALNMPAGAVKATASLVSTGQTLGSVNLYVRAGQLSVGWIRMRVH